MREKTTIEGSLVGRPLAKLMELGATALPWCYRLLFLGYAVLLSTAADGDRIVMLTSGLLLAHVFVHALPWRIPRDDRTPRGYWLEALVCSFPLGIAAVVWLAEAPGQELARLPARMAPLWFGASVLVGLFLVRLIRIRWQAVVNGDLAFLSGPLAPHRAAARTWMIAVGTLAEEVVFRALPAGLDGSTTLALAAGAATFIAGHHIVRGSLGRDRWLLVRYELAAALLFGGLVVASGSIWPAVAAHAVANIPMTVLDWQRARIAAFDDASGKVT